MFLYLLINIWLTLIPLLQNALDVGNWELGKAHRYDYWDRYLIALTALSLGFSYTVHLWCTNQVLAPSKKIRRHLRASGTNSLFIFFVVIMLVGRYCSLLAGMRLEQQVIYQERANVILCTLPIFILLFNWTFLSKAYRSYRAIIISVFILLALGLLLAIFTF